MADKMQITVADFYHQLGLLVRSKLPLPESLTQLAASFEEPAFRQTVDDLAAKTADGIPLHSAMAQHEKLFAPLHIRLVRLGEESGTLDELLFEVATIARNELRLINCVRETVAYPALVMWISVAVFVALLRFVVVDFRLMFEEMLAGEALPTLTQFVVDLSAFVESNEALVFVSLVAGLGGLLWMSWQSRASNRCVYLLIRVIPGAGHIARAYDYCRLTRIWGLLLSHGLSTVEGLRQTAALMVGSDVGRYAQRWAERNESGADVKTVILEQAGVDGLLGLTIKHAHESTLPQALQELSDVYEERAQGASNVAAMTWEAIMVILTAVVVGTIVIGMFMPLIQLIDAL